MSNVPYKYSDLPPVYNNFNRLLYDKCAYANQLYESTSPLAYQIYPPAYESCRKCFMGYPGFIGAMGGTEGSNPVGPLEVDLESDLRNQTRINTLCPSHKYMPKCAPNCKSNKNGYPCNGKCRLKNTNNPPDCPDRDSIIPVSSVDSRQIKSCNNLSGIHINRFNPGLKEDPQDPTRIFKLNSNYRAGMDTYQLNRDMHDYNYGSPCLNYKLPKNNRCKHGGMGCAPANSNGGSTVFLPPN